MAYINKKHILTVLLCKYLHKISHFFADKEAFIFGYTSERSHEGKAFKVEAKSDVRFENQKFAWYKFNSGDISNKDTLRFWVSVSDELTFWPALKAHQNNQEEIFEIKQSGGEIFLETNGQVRSVMLEGPVIRLEKNFTGWVNIPLAILERPAWCKGGDGIIDLKAGFIELNMKFEIKKGVRFYIDSLGYAKRSDKPETSTSPIVTTTTATTAVTTTSVQATTTGETEGPSIQTTDTSLFWTTAESATIGSTEASETVNGGKRSVAPFIVAGVIIASGKKQITDVYSRMYSSLEFIKEYIEDPGNTQPFFLCEYSIAMGNGQWQLLLRWDGVFK